MAALVLAAWLFGAAGAGMADSIVVVAQDHRGLPYQWGGSSHAGFDCAGFVSHVYEEAGSPLPSRWMPALHATNPVEGEPEPGDLVFFENTYKPGLSHVGIYLGDGRFIHAAGEQWGVIVSELSRPYWVERYAGASRP